MTNDPAGARTADAGEILGQAKIGPYQLLVGVLCAGILFVDGYNVAVLSYVAPVLSNALHVTRAELGPVLSANMFGNFAGFFLLPALSHRVGPKRTAIIAMLIFSASEILAALSGSVPGLLVFRFTAGVGLAGALVSAVSLTGEYFPLRWRSSAVTYMFLGYTLGQMSAGAAAQILLHTGLGWQAPVIFGGSVALVYAVFLLKALPDSVEYLVNRSGAPERAIPILNRVAPASVPARARVVAGHKEIGRAPIRQLFEERRGFTTLMFWFAAIMSFGVASIMHSWLTTLLVDSGLNYDVAVSTTVFVTAAGVAAGLTVGPLMDKFGPFIVMVGLFLGSAAAATVLGFITPLLIVAPIAAAAFAQAYCGSGLTKGANAMAVYLYPTALRPAGLGWVLGVGRIGGTVGPIAVGLLLHAGWIPADVFRAIALPLVLGAAALYLGYRRHRRSEDAPAPEPSAARDPA